MTSAVLIRWSPAWGFVVGLLSAACGRPEVPAREPQSGDAPELGVLGYLPADDGHILVFNTSDDSSGESGMLVYRVSRPRPELLELDAAGTVLRLELSADGARHVSGGWMLHLPLEDGAVWDGEFGEVRVTSASRSIAVPAGSFSNCVETVEADAERRQTLVLCPGVGPVLMEVEEATEADVRVVRAELVSYGPAVDIDSPPDPDVHEAQ
jgi:hypothetical protein